jgi:hypothetical protein
MPKKKRKKKKQSKSKKPQADISRNANPIRFFIFLAIGLVLLALFFYAAYQSGGFLTLQQEMAGP